MVFQEGKSDSLCTYQAVTIFEDTPDTLSAYVKWCRSASLVKNLPELLPPLLDLIVLRCHSAPNSEQSTAMPYRAYESLSHPSPTPQPPPPGVTPSVQGHTSGELLRLRLWSKSLLCPCGWFSAQPLRCLPPGLRERFLSARWPWRSASSTK